MLGYFPRKMAAPLSKPVSPVMNSSSLSAIFSTSHRARPFSIWALASSRLSHRGGRRLGSKEMMAPLCLAWPMALQVAARTPSWVMDRVPKWKIRLSAMASRGSSSSRSIMSAPGLR